MLRNGPEEPSGVAAAVFVVALSVAGVAALPGCSAEGSGSGPLGGVSGSTHESSAGSGLGGDTAGNAAVAGASGEAAAAGTGSGSGGSGGEATAGIGSSGSGGGKPLDDACAGIQEKAEAKLLPSDVIWAIDTSGSMTGSFPAIQQALNDFSTSVIAAGIDARIILLAGSGLCVPAPLGSGQCGPGAPALDTREPEFLHLDIPFGWSAGMSVILDNYDAYKHLLRPDAQVQFVLTEDGPPPMLAADVVDRIEGRGANPWDPPLQPGNWTFNGIVCVNGAGVGTCFISMVIPTTTLELIQSTSGIVADLDLAGQPGADPFAELLDKLATAVIVGATISCEYEIPPPPQNQEFDRNLVNVVYTDSAGAEIIYPMLPEGAACDDKLAWRYDDPAQPAKVIFCPATCDLVQQDMGAQISVKFGCATVLLE